MLDYFSNVLDPLEFIERINSTGGTEMSTAAHYAALRSKTEIFEILMTHEFDIWKPNLRGLRPFDIISKNLKIGHDFKKIQVFNVQTVRDQLKHYFLKNIIFSCKLQSLVNKQFFGERTQLISVIEKSSYELPEDLRAFKVSVENQYKRFFKNANAELMGITNYLNKVQFENTLNPLDQRQALFSLFRKSELQKIAIFKYSQGEKWEKRELLNLIDNEIDFSKPLSSSLKSSFNMR